jgi:hypothetical protein
MSILYMFLMARDDRDVQCAHDWSWYDILVTNR